MAKNAGKPTDQTELSLDEQLEIEKKKALLDFLTRSREFMAVDADINRSLQRLLATVAKYAEENPGILFTSNADLETLAKELNEKLNINPGVAGGDIVGGGVLDDIADFINKVGDFISKEKEFFLKIIFLIFCKDKACECLCKCMCTPCNCADKK